MFFIIIIIIINDIDSNTFVYNQKKSNGIVLTKYQQFLILNTKTCQARDFY